jgi:outer membrane protein OmpA-like peptidoglycan-associated protein
MHRQPARYLVLLMLALVFTGCSVYESNPRTVKGAGVGAVGGAGAGAAVGAIVGGGKGAGEGAAIGAVLGALGGSLIGNYMDNQAKEMEGVLAEQDRLRRQQDQLQVILANDVLFSSGSATMQPGARDKLRRLADILNRYPSETVQVVGYTDSRGGEESNLDLSRRRAQAVADELAAAGVSASRISVRGLGAAQPVASNETPEGRGQNRRVEINITPDQNMKAGQGGGGTGGGAYEEPR